MISAHHRSWQRLRVLRQQFRTLAHIAGFFDETNQLRSSDSAENWSWHEDLDHRSFAGSDRQSRFPAP
jgi:hypothetical protein